MRKPLWGAALVLALAAVARADAISLTATASQSDTLDFIDDPPAAPFEIATFDFSGDPNLAAFLAGDPVRQVSITLRMDDGDTGAGDYDEGELTLGLDGVDTGILLNGFTDNTTVTLTITGLTASGSAILAALGDGQLVATIFDATGGDNQLYVPGTFTASLTVTNPEPSTIALFAAGLAGVAIVGRRARRRKPLRGRGSTTQQLS